MTEPVIVAERLGKAYTIKHKLAPYTTLRDALVDGVRSLARRGRAREQREEFWALRDLSFQVSEGDRLGIVGRNGAGKSTLLKLLSRITAPTTGRIVLERRVASLLEVGTGFHAELSGRENIFLNGAVLGMKQREIRQKFDEIVAFAEIDRFLDTPVKRYSSGMYVRLAFAVAAHLDPEILIIDEVLAVGDAKFQKKCLGKMEDVSRHGRTILFVSHNMGAVKSLCNRAILLDGGVKVIDGSVEAVIDKYTGDRSDAPVFEPIVIDELGITVANIALNPGADDPIAPFNPLEVVVELHCEREVSDIGIWIMLSHDDTRGTVFASNTKITKNLDVKLKPGTNKLTLQIKNFNLCSGTYWLGLGIDQPFIRFFFHDEALLPFDVAEVMVEPRLVPTLPAWGHVYLDHDWLVS